MPVHLLRDGGQQHQPEYLPITFAKSDASLPDAELAKEGLLELPVVVGGVVPVVNIPDIKSGQSH